MSPIWTLTWDRELETKKKKIKDTKQVNCTSWWNEINILCRRLKLRLFSPNQRAFYFQVCTTRIFFSITYTNNLNLQFLWCVFFSTKKKHEKITCTTEFEAVANSMKTKAMNYFLSIIKEWLQVNLMPYR